MTIDGARRRWQDHFVKVRQLVQEVKAPRPSYLITIGKACPLRTSDKLMETISRRHYPFKLFRLPPSTPVLAYTVAESQSQRRHEEGRKEGHGQYRQRERGVSG